MSELCQSVCSSAGHFVSVCLHMSSRNQKDFSLNHVLFLFFFLLPGFISLLELFQSIVRITFFFFGDVVCFLSTTLKMKGLEAINNTLYKKNKL